MLSVVVIHHTNLTLSRLVMPKKSIWLPQMEREYKVLIPTSPTALYIFSGGDILFYTTLLYVAEMTPAAISDKILLGLIPQM